MRSTPPARGQPVACVESAWRGRRRSVGEEGAGADEREERAQQRVCAREGVLEDRIRVRLAYDRSEQDKSLSHTQQTGSVKGVAQMAQERAWCGWLRKGHGVMGWTAKEGVPSCGGVDLEEPR